MTKESKLHVEGLSVPRVKPFEHDEVTNPKHYHGINGLEAIEVHRNFLTREEL